MSLKRQGNAHDYCSAPPEKRVSLEAAGNSVPEHCSPPREDPVTLEAANGSVHDHCAPTPGKPVSLEIASRTVSSDACETEVAAIRVEDKCGLALSQHEILHTVLSHFPARHLCCLRRVCRQWKRAIEAILSSRASGQHCFSSDACQSRASDVRPVEALLARLLERCSVLPHWVLVVYTGVESSAVPDCASLQRRLPADCSLLTLGSQSGCMASDARGDVHELQEAGVMVGALATPRLDGVRVFQCSLRAQRHIDRQLRSLLPADFLPTVRAVVLVYSDEKGARCARRLARYIWAERSGRVALAGGWADGCGTDRVRDGSLQLVLFAGDGVLASSVVVGDEQCASVGSLRGSEVLKSGAGARLLAAERRAGWRAWALVSACCARGLYGRPRQQESACLHRELGPQVPVLGLFVNGELGCTWLPGRGDRHKECGRRLQQDTDMLLQYTTVMLLLQFAS